MIGSPGRFAAVLLEPSFYVPGAGEWAGYRRLGAPSPLPRRVSHFLASADPWRYHVFTMATETATIRVPISTRDQLARRARERGVSVASMLTEFAETLTRDAIYRSEREATRADARNPDVAAEEHDWETVVGDGIE